MKPHAKEVSDNLATVLAMIQADPNVAPRFKVAMRPLLTDAERIRKLRAALSGLIDLVTSFEDVTLTRDIEQYKAEAIYDEELRFAKSVMKETA